MNSLSMNKGVIQSERMTPLISFYTIFDVDFGLINLIFSKYLSPTVFNKSYFENKETIDIVVDLYGRENENPLYKIANDNIDKKILDGYYQEFLSTKEDDIYSCCITTSVLNMVDSFITSQIIKPNILCYNDIQVKYVKDEPILKPCPIIMSNELKSDTVINSFDQYFFKSVKEVDFIKDIVRAKMIYFSSYGPNMNKEDLIEPDIIMQLIKNKNQISIFDTYNSYILGGVE